MLETFFLHKQLIFVWVGSESTIDELIGEFDQTF